MSEGITLDQVNVELTSDSSKASKGIDSLVSSLESLKSSSSGAIGGLSNLDNTIKSLMKNFSGLSGSTSSFKNLSDSIRNLKNSASNMQNVKFTGKTSDLDLQRQKIEQNKQALEQMQTTASKGTNLNAGTNISELSSKLDALINKQNILNKNSNLLLHGYRGASQEATGLAGAIDRVSGAFKALDKGGRNFVKSIRPAVSIVKSAASHARGLAKSLSDTTGVGKTVKHLSKYLLALFSIRGTYAAINAMAKHWLQSSSLAAQQLSANIDYLKYALGSAVAPIIEYIANLIYSVLKVIQTVIYILTGINVFAKAFAKNMKSAAGSASKVKKELTLAPFDELNTIGNLSGRGGSGKAGKVAPTFDLTKVDLKYNKWVKKLVNFFKPLVESWKKYGPGLINQIKLTAASTSRAISATWKSFENIITNGTVYRTLQRILKIIQNISDAWAKAWTNNKNGDKIIQNLATTFENLVKAVEKVTSSEAFQKWLSNAIDKIRQISDKIAQINWQPLIDYLAKLGGKIGNAALWTLEKIVDLFKWLVEHPKAITIIVGVIGAFLALKAVLGIGKSIREFVGAFSNIGKIFGGTKKSADDTANSLGEIGEATSGATSIFKKFFDGLGKGAVAIAILGGIALVIKELSGLIKTFSESGLQLSDTALLIGSSIGIITLAFTGMMGIMTLMKPSWQSIAAAAVILGGFALVINQVANLLNVFSKSGLKVKDVVGLMATVFVPIVALMGAVALIGPAMTAGLIPFAAVILGINATLIVVSKTLPIILDACAKFINSVAPSIKSILETLGEQITNIIKALGVSLPPIINSVGGLFNTIFNGISRVVNSVGNVIIGILNSAKSLVTTVLSSILNFINRLGPAVNNFVNGMITATTRLINFLISGIEYMVNTLIIGAINKLISAVNSIPLVNVPKLPRASIPRFKGYAEGGFPTTGDLFIANEAGPELIGRMGNQTAVANNDQITEGIREAAYAAMTQALSENSQGHKTEVYIGNEKVYEGYGRYQNYQSNKYGVSTIRI